MSHSPFPASILAQFKPRLLSDCAFAETAVPEILTHIRLGFGISALRLGFRETLRPLGRLADEAFVESEIVTQSTKVGAILKPKNARAGKTLNVPGCD